ncbi:MAG: hypothetical protein V4509_04605 [Patescibacteria group bacterium]
MELNITLNYVDYDFTVRQRVTMTAIRLGFSVLDSGDKQFVRYSLSGSNLSKISQVIRRIKACKKDSDNGYSKVKCPVCDKPFVNKTCKECDELVENL